MTGPWFLPAKRVQLSDTWSPKNPTFRVGEAVTRAVRLLALGASEEQLPDISIADADGARLYLERTNVQSVDTSEGTAAIREFVVSIVPTRAGEVSLPAIDVRWWDTTDDTQRVASLPAQVISVAPGAASAGGGPRSGTASSPPTSTLQGNAAPVPVATTGFRTSQILISLLLALISVGAIGLLVLSVRRWRQDQNSNAPSSTASAPLRGVGAKERRGLVASIEHELVRACKANELPRAYAALISWLRAVRFSSRSSTASSAIPSDLSAELAAMEKQLYAEKADQPWSGESLLGAFATERRTLHECGDARKSQRGIPALYPG